MKRTHLSPEERAFAAEIAHRTAVRVILYVGIGLFIVAVLSKVLHS